MIAPYYTDDFCTIYHAAGGFAMNRKLAIKLEITPRPKGSIRAFNIRGRSRPVLTSTTNGLKQYQGAIASAARLQWNGGPTSAPVEVACVFGFSRPKSPKHPTRHVVRPDIDKLLRAILDALTGVVYIDDSQAVYVNGTKTYSDVDCVWIGVKEIED
jgi:Holliday junction resolvase RusA-like endonuclease